MSARNAQPAFPENAEPAPALPEPAPALPEPAPALPEPALALLEPAAEPPEPAPATPEPATPEPGTGTENDRQRAENVASALSVEELDALFAGSTAVMGESDIKALYQSLGEEPWLPGWAKTPPAQEYTVDDVYNAGAGAGAGARGGGRAASIRQAMRGLEDSVAAVDDTALRIYDQVEGLTEDVKDLRHQLTETEATLLAQNSATSEEIRELRHSILQLRLSLSQLQPVILGLALKGPRAPEPGPS